MWTPNMEDSVWASWSGRHARLPSASDATILSAPSRRRRDPRFRWWYWPPGPEKAGTDAERVDTLELGYRRNLGNGSFEAVLFHNDYHRLISEQTDPNGLVFPTSPLPVALRRADPVLAAGQPVCGTQPRDRGGRGSALTAALRLQASYTSWIPVSGAAPMPPPMRRLDIWRSPRHSTGAACA
jgi:hypothetical protein